MKKLAYNACSVIILIGMIMAIGAMGAIEQNTMPTGTAMVVAIISIAMSFIAALAGNSLRNKIEAEEKRHAQPRHYEGTTPQAYMPRHAIPEYEPMALGKSMTVRKPRPY